MSRGHHVFLVKRNSMTTSDAADKVRVQCIEGSGFWRSRKGKEEKGGFEGCEVGKIRLGDKKKR
jgi:hypothetical protein